METREAILNFQYAEKMKSGLIIGTHLLAQIDSLKELERSGGVRVLVWFLEGLLREVRIGGRVTGVDQSSELEQKVMEVIGRMEMAQFNEAQRSFSEALSLATTLCQASMTFLVERNLI